MPLKIVNKTGRSVDTKVFVINDDGTEIDITAAADIYNTKIEIRADHSVDAKIYVLGPILDILDSKKILYVETERKNGQKKENNS